ncbi:MAG: helix-turn-helix domain-containing protein [Rhodospirillaceae bacterium]
MNTADDLNQLDALAIIDRMKEAAETSLDTELATYLGLPKTTVSSWRRRKTIPYSDCVRLSYMTGQPVDWILTGRTPEVTKSIWESNIDLDLLTLFVFSNINSFPDVEDMDQYSRAELITRNAVRLYIKHMATMRKLQSEKSVSRDAYLEILKTTIFEEVSGN